MSGHPNHSLVQLLSLLSEKNTMCWQSGSGGLRLVLALRFCSGQTLCSLMQQCMTREREKKNSKRSLLPQQQKLNNSDNKRDLITEKPLSGKPDKI